MLNLDRSKRRETSKRNALADEIRKKGDKKMKLTRTEEIEMILVALTEKHYKYKTIGETGKWHGVGYQGELQKDYAHKAYELERVMDRYKAEIEFEKKTF
jgi:hypothetical protein